MTWKKNNSDSTPWWGTGAGAAGIATGSAAFGTTMIDLRPKVNTASSPYLGASWEQVKKHVQPGDIIVGATKTAPETLALEAKDFWRTLRKSRKSGLSWGKSLQKGINQFDVASVASKFGDPEASHVGYFISPSKTSYVGGWTQLAGGEDIPFTKEVKSKYWQKRTPHYTLLRPTGPGMTKGLTVAEAQRLAGGSERYSMRMAIGNTLKDWLVPKLNRGEKLKSQAVRSAELCMNKGICSTMPARLSTYTIGGKGAKHILPQDYLRAGNYKAVGRIGTGKISPVSKALFNIPKFTTKATAAGLLGLGAYGLTRAMTKQKGKPLEKTASIEDMIFEGSYEGLMNGVRQEAFNDEIQKLAAARPETIKYVLQYLRRAAPHASNVALNQAETYVSKKVAPVSDEYKPPRLRKTAELIKISIKAKSTFQKLQDNKIPLDPEERSEVLSREAIWHHGPNGEATPAVWKSKHPKTGEITYITNTHRAYNTATTLKGAIGRYHKFIKGTA